MLAIAAEFAGVDSGQPLGELLCGLDDTNHHLVQRAVSRVHGDRSPAGGAGACIDRSA